MRLAILFGLILSLAHQASAQSKHQELRRHFDVVTESFKSDFKNLFDWAEVTTSSTGARVDGLESGHGSSESRRHPSDAGR